MLMALVFEFYMESSIYTSASLKINKAFREREAQSLLTLKDFLDHKFIIQGSDQLKKVFIKDLKKLLEEENIFILIQHFFDLESDLNNALERLDLETNFINFDEFYKNLSPVILRGLLENVSTSESAPGVLNSIKEALRIALEEELLKIEDEIEN